MPSVDRAMPGRPLGGDLQTRVGQDRVVACLWRRELRDSGANGTRTPRGVRVALREFGRAAWRGGIGHPTGKKGGHDARSQQNRALISSWSPPLAGGVSVITASSPLRIESTFRPAAGCLPSNDTAPKLSGDSARTHVSRTPGRRQRWRTWPAPSTEGRPWIAPRRSAVRARLAPFPENEGRTYEPSAGVESSDVILCVRRLTAGRERPARQPGIRFKGGWGAFTPEAAGTMFDVLPIARARSARRWCLRVPPCPRGSGRGQRTPGRCRLWRRSRSLRGAHL